jgi:hypothetical protein
MEEEELPIPFEPLIDDLIKEYFEQYYSYNGSVPTWEDYFNHWYDGRYSKYCLETWHGEAQEYEKAQFELKRKEYISNKPKVKKTCSDGFELSR